MAIKSINVFEKDKRHQLINDLKSLRLTQCPFLVQMYGAYYDEGSVKVALELMNLGSISSVLKSIR